MTASATSTPGTPDRGPPGVRRGPGRRTAHGRAAKAGSDSASRAGSAGSADDRARNSNAGAPRADPHRTTVPPKDRGHALSAEIGRAGQPRLALVRHVRRTPALPAQRAGFLTNARRGFRHAVVRTRRGDQPIAEQLDLRGIGRLLRRHDIVTGIGR